MEIYDYRIKKTKKIMEEKGIALLIITPSSDLYYLTGYTRPATDRLTALLLTDQHTSFLCPAIEKNYLSELSCQAEAVLWADSEDPFCKISSHLGVSKNACLKAAAGSRMESGWLIRLMELYPKLSWVNAQQVLGPLRRVKSEEETDIIREAQSMAERAFTRLLQTGLEGKTEQQLSGQLMKLRLEEGFDCVGPGLIACGPNSASPHPVLTDRVIRPGDTVMFDFGGTYKGYHADMTRTCGVRHVSEEFREVYAIVLEAHMAALKAAGPGVPCRDMDMAGRNIIEKAGYGSYFTHRLGHGIGLDIHEQPFASAGDKGILESGNVLSDEPGIYLPGRFGIRIEDLVVITDTGSQTLNTMSRELVIV